MIRLLFKIKNGIKKNGFVKKAVFLTIIFNIDIDNGEKVL